MKKSSSLLNNAAYIWPKTGADGQNVYAAFRMVIDSLPARFDSVVPVEVSAASFYRLWVNGKSAGRGPVREWKGHIGVDSWDLKPFLQPGRNVISAIVHYYGAADVGLLQLTRGAFLFHGNVNGQDVSTGKAAWECRILPGWNKKSPRISLYNGFCEDVDMSLYTSGLWEYGDGARGWQKPATVSNPQKYWPCLEPRTIPPLSEKSLTLSLDSSDSIIWPDVGSWAERIVKMKVKPALKRIESFESSFPIRVLPGKPVHLRFDAGGITSGGVRLRLHAAGGEIIYIAYADRLAANGNADATHGGNINNNVDRLTLRSGLNSWESMINLRAFRYADLLFFNLREPVVIEEISAGEIIYPVEKRGRFQCSDPVWNRIWEASCRTASLCMSDTFMDNPSRERQQYGGDGRIQARYAWDYFGDERLTRQFLRQYGQGIRADGAIQSGGPWCWNQIIPAWQMHWIEAVREYVERSGDESILAEIARPASLTLDWMHGLLAADGLLAVPEKFDYVWPDPDVLWNFMDWQGIKDQVRGEPARIPLNCLYYQTLLTAAAIMKRTGQNAKAKVLEQRRHDIGRVLHGMFAKGKGLETEHALTFATLAGLVRGKLTPLADKVASGRFVTDLPGMPFLMDALVQEGHFAEALTGVRSVCERMLNEGGTTCFETREAMQAENGRAVCQGISAFAGYYMLRFLAGIQPVSYKQRKANIQPCLLNVDWLTASLPVPDGEITVRIEKSRNGPVITTNAPPGWTLHIG